MKERYLWGIDLGGTKIEGVVLDTQNNYEPVCRLRVPTLASEGYSKIIDQIVLLINTLKKETGLTPTRLGIGTPGRLDRQSQTIKNSNTTCINDQPFLKDLYNKINIPIKIENDANCFAMSEANYLLRNEMPEAEIVFGVIMGSGVGGGIIANGKIISGLQGIAGEWGHNFLDESGEACYCGKHGCVETILSGKALERFYQNQSGQFLKLKEIVERYRKGIDPDAEKTMERLFTFFGKGMANIINVLDPHAIVIGGGVGNIDELYTKGVERIGDFIFNTQVDTKILKPKFGDSSGVFGAALL